MVLFKSGTVVDFILLLGISLCVLYYWWLGSKGKYREIREIPGISAIREAIGRATEMNRPVHFALGDKADIKGVYVPQIVAGLSVLTDVAATCARLGTRLICTLGGSGGGGAEVLPLLEETVYDAYKAEGEEQAFVRENIRYCSGDRDSWAMAVIGIFYREKPVANIMIGPWAGTSLPILEIGARTGQIQIGGTARTYMMAIFATICDYFLIGEEIYAAGAILSKDPVSLATVGVGDIFKIIVGGLILVGVVSLLAGSQWLMAMLYM